MSVPPPPPPTGVYGSPEWGYRAMASLPPADAAVVSLLVGIGLGTNPPPPPGKHAFASLHRARCGYAGAVFERNWDGPTARLVWDVLCAIIKPREDDIPF